MKDFFICRALIVSAIVLIPFEASIARSIKMEIASGTNLKNLVQMTAFAKNKFTSSIPEDSNPQAYNLQAYVCSPGLASCEVETNDNEFNLAGIVAPAGVKVSYCLGENCTNWKEYYNGGEKYDFIKYPNPGRNDPPPDYSDVQFDDKCSPCTIRWKLQKFPNVDPVANEVLVIPTNTAPELETISKTSTNGITVSLGIAKYFGGLPWNLTVERSEQSCSILQDPGPDAGMETSVPVRGKLSYSGPDAQDFNSLQAATGQSGGHMKKGSWVWGIKTPIQFDKTNGTARQWNTDNTVNWVPQFSDALSNVSTEDLPSGGQRWDSSPLFLPRSASLLSGRLDKASLTSETDAVSLEWSYQHKAIQTFYLRENDQHNNHVRPQFLLVLESKWFENNAKIYFVLDNGKIVSSRLVSPLLPRTQAIEPGQESPWTNLGSQIVNASDKIAGSFSLIANVEQVICSKDTTNDVIADCDQTTTGYSGDSIDIYPSDSKSHGIKAVVRGPLSNGVYIREEPLNANAGETFMWVHCGTSWRAIPGYGQPVGNFRNACTVATSKLIFDTNEPKTITAGEEINTRIRVKFTTTAPPCNDPNYCAP